MRVYLVLLVVITHIHFVVLLQHFFANRECLYCRVVLFVEFQLLSFRIRFCQTAAVRHMRSCVFISDLCLQEEANAWLRNMMSSALVSVAFSHLQASIVLNVE